MAKSVAKDSRITEPRVDHAAALRLFQAVAQAWGLTQEERRILLGGVSASTYADWTSGRHRPRLSIDTLERIGNLVAIRDNLHALFSMAPERADSWVKRGNAALGGRTALDVMRSGHLPAIVDVRRYLDAQIAPWG